MLIYSQLSEENFWSGFWWSMGSLAEIANKGTNASSFSGRVAEGEFDPFYSSLWDDTVPCENGRKESI